MKLWILGFFILLMIFGLCPAQENQKLPTASQSAPSASSSVETAPANNNSKKNKNTYQEQRRQTQLGKSFQDLSRLEMPDDFRISARAASLEIQSLYRKPNKKELKNLMPSPELLSKYDKFLQQPNTGIFKLSGDSSCSINEKVIVATENCLEKDIPGAGTAYSFRVKSHRLLHLADVILDKDIIRSDGIIQQGIMVNLGDLELESVSAQTDGIKFLLDFKPSTTVEDLQKTDQELGDGIKADGFIYQYGFYADDKTTFALRSIAYRNKIPRSVSGFRYNEMDFDKRKDILVVFRIIEKETNGDITVLWKELFQQDSPKLNLTKKDK